MADSLGGYWLSEPRLRFDYENRNALSDKAYDGLRNLGPYDLAERRKHGKKIVRVAVIGREDRQTEMDAAIAALTERRMGKLHDVFEIKVTERVLTPSTTTKGEASAYRTAVQDWLGRGRGAQNIDLAIVLHEDEEQYRIRARGISPYYATKASLLMAGIPTQSICYKNLIAGPRLKAFESYFVPNILTACYAKLGGKPWVIQGDAPGRPEITLGVATTAVLDSDRGAERFVGISTIFKENGAFALWEITPLHQDWTEYEKSLESSIVQAIEAYEKMENRQVERIACHVSGKRAGRREIQAITRALSGFSPRKIAADLVHITDDAILWLFDGRDLSHRPEAGFLTQLTSDGRVALLHTEGRDGSSAKKFPPRPLKLGVHGDLRSDGCHDVYQHLYDLRWMSWRGVGTAARPVSIDYPARMSKLLAHLYAQEEVDAINFLPKLTTSAWFL
jgi:hypothetical protein